MKNKQIELDEKRVYHCVKNKVKHFAPTISPAPKNNERNEIESIYSALEYYRENGMNELIIQKKYMGSYCDIELHAEINDSRLFSRNAYLIDFLNKDEITSALKPIHKRFNWDLYSKVLIQTELMPWSAIGEGLIEKEFKAYNFLYQNHIDYLKQSTLYDKLGNLTMKNIDKMNQYSLDETYLNKEELNIKYKQHEKNNFSCLNSFKWLDLDEIQKGLTIHKDQVDLYARKEPINFKPFNVLKYYRKDGTEIIETSNIKGFQQVSDDDYCVVDLNQFDDAVKKAYNFFEKCVNDKEEGIIIKPSTAFIKNVVHAFKVRNYNYLHMIYGANFGVDYDYYLRKRNIRKKMKMQITQWEIAQNLLLLMDNEINDKNKRYRELLFLRFQSERKSVELDSRL